MYADEDVINRLERPYKLTEDGTTFLQIILLGNTVRYRIFLVIISWISF
jgi:hypothetical protein